MSSSSASSSASVNEFNDGRKRPPYDWSTSFTDWFKHSWKSSFSGEKVEERLLSFLPFFPKPDGKRSAKFIDTDIGGGNYIHEFYIENKETDSDKHPNLGSVKDIVLVHGYAASLGLFFDNYEDLSAIPGVKLHAIDMLGFGRSSRPKYPKFGVDTKEDIYQNEDWFLDSIEEWRKRRGIERFTLIGHSLGGYLSSAYAMKYNKLVKDAAGNDVNMINKLVLLSPVGVERHEKSLLKDKQAPATQLPETERRKENSLNPEVSLSKELTSNQEDIVAGDARDNQPVDTEKPKDRRTRLFHYLWQKHVSPFTIARNAGPFKSKIMSGWTTHRFSHIYFQDKERFQNIHDYFYHIFNLPGSGEYAITRLLAVGALARLPLLDRCPEKFTKMNLPTLWVYGDKDWMNREAGKEMVEEINSLSEAKGKGKLADYAVLKNAGHHLYLDNPPAFTKLINDFLSSS